MNTQSKSNENEMSVTLTYPFSTRRWSLVLFLAVLVGLAQFGLGQFSPWVIAAPFVALLLCDLEGAWSKGQGAGSQSGALPQFAAAFVFHGVVIGAVMTAAGGAAHDSGGRFVMAKASPSGGCGSGGMCGGGQAASKNGTLASSATGGCGSGGCGSAAGGCGSGGCGAGGGGTVASSATGGAAKSACGCGGGASGAVSNPRAVAVNLPPQQQSQIGMVAPGQNGILANSATGMLARPGMGSAMPPPVRVLSNQPMVANPGGRVPGVMNMPLPGQAQGQSPISSDRPVNRGTGLQNERQPQPDLATAIQRAATLPGAKTVPAMPPPLIAAPAANPTAPASPVMKTEEGAPKETKEPKNEPKPAGP